MHRNLPPLPAIFQRKAPAPDVNLARIRLISDRAFQVRETFRRPNAMVTASTDLLVVSLRSRSLLTSPRTRRGTAGSQRLLAPTGGKSRPPALADPAAGERVPTDHLPSCSISALMSQTITWVSMAGAAPPEPRVRTAGRAKRSSPTSFRCELSASIIRKETSPVPPATSQKTALVV
eukprot:753410-Hanusia_phi.AAC.4